MASLCRVTSEGPQDGPTNFREFHLDLENALMLSQLAGVSREEHNAAFLMADIKVRQQVKRFEDVCGEWIKKPNNLPVAR